MAFIYELPFKLIFNIIIRNKIFSKKCMHINLKSLFLLSFFFTSICFLFVKLMKSHERKTAGSLTSLYVERLPSIHFIFPYQLSLILLAVIETLANTTATSLSSYCFRICKQCVLKLNIAEEFFHYYKFNNNHCLFQNRMLTLPEHQCSHPFF